MGIKEFLGAVMLRKSQAENMFRAAVMIGVKTSKLFLVNDFCWCNNGFFYITAF